MSDNRWKVKTIENYVLLNKDIKEIEIDESDEWQFPDYTSDYASIKIWVGDDMNNDLRKRLELDKDEQDFLDNEGWVDCYVNIDVKTDTIFNIYVSAYLGDHEKDLNIHFDLPDMGKRLYDYLLNSHGGYAEFIAECKKDIEEQRALREEYSVCVFMSDILPKWNGNSNLASIDVKGKILLGWYKEHIADHVGPSELQMIQDMNTWYEQEYTAEDTIGLYEYANKYFVDGVSNIDLM